MFELLKARSCFRLDTPMAIKKEIYPILGGVHM